MDKRSSPHSVPEQRVAGSEPSAPLPRQQRLRDGRVCLLRLIEPADADRLQRFVGGLSDETAHQRFFASVHALSAAQLERFTRNSDPLEFAIVALTEASNGLTIIGTARCLRTDGQGVVEFAVTIADAWQSAGLGTVLLGEMIAEARRRDIRLITGEALSDNSRMLKLARDHGFSVHADPSDATLSVLRLAL